MNLRNGQSRGLVPEKTNIHEQLAGMASEDIFLQNIQLHVEQSFKVIMIACGYFFEYFKADFSKNPPDEIIDYLVS